MARRVVVTGIGLVCAVGNTTAEVWPALLAGKNGVDRITGAPDDGDAELPLDELDLEGLSELASSGPEDEDEEDEDDEDDEDDEAAARPVAPARKRRAKRSR